MDGSNIVLYWVIIMAIFSLIMIIFGIRREIKIRKHGIEVEAVATKVVSDRITDGPRRGRFDYTPYVKYIGDDNQEHEAWLNCNVSFSVGEKLDVKYLPGKYDYVVLIVK